MSIFFSFNLLIKITKHSKDITPNNIVEILAISEL